jgi:hypothetical protein
MLAPADAHDLYRSYGFTDVADPECYLERAVPATELYRASPGIDLARGPALHHLRPVSVVLIRVEVRPARVAAVVANPLDVEADSMWMSPPFAVQIG